LHLEIETLGNLLGLSGLGNFNVVVTTTHSRGYKLMLRIPIVRYCGSKRKEHATSHSLIPLNYLLDTFALTATLSTILKTLYHAKSHTAIPPCVPESASNITCI
jgi:hypothetical protein